jgi:hypothetical protein
MTAGRALSRDGAPRFALGLTRDYTGRGRRHISRSSPNGRFRYTTMYQAVLRCFVAVALSTALACISACGGGSNSAAPAAPSPPPGASESTADPAAQAVVAGMLAELPARIAGFLAQEQADLPRNPQNVIWMQAKIAMLQDPELAARIIAGKFYETGRVGSSKGGQVPIVAIFPSEEMRSAASEAVSRTALSLTALEGFIGVPFPPASIRIWYGFVVGASGGGGVITSEDRETFEARRASRPFPVEYFALFDHELAHTWIGHESLTGFLELNAFNTIETGSDDPSTWWYAKTLTPYVPFNDNVAHLALLDVYRLVGRDAMARAYRSIYLLAPPYGTMLSAECKQAFIDEAPAAEKARVAGILERVTY